MSESENDQDEQPPPPSKREQLGFGVQIGLAIGLFLICVYAPWIVTIRYGNLWALLTSIAAFFIWAVLGPRPFPGFLPGIMGTMVLMSNVICGVTSGVRLILDVYHHTSH